MPDLADRISRGAVAALDLAPFDDRFGRLSRQVLAGGASRFQRVIADDRPIEFLIPVGLAHERIDYGALVLQDGHAGVLWRDASGLDRCITVPIGPDTHATFGAVTLGGEQWTRFDVAGEPVGLTFLVPPVNSPLLRSTLIEYFRARPGHAHTQPLPEPEQPAPAVRVPPVPAPAPVVAPAPEVESAPEVEPAPVVESAPAPERVADEPAPTALLPAVDAAPEQTVAPGGPETDADATMVAPIDPEAEDATLIQPSVDGDATRIHPPTDREHASWVPPAEPALAAAAPPPAPTFDLYRDDRRTPSPEPGAGAVQAPAQPAAASVPAQQVGTGTSATLRGFLIGLFATLAIGGVFLLFQYLTG